MTAREWFLELLTEKLPSSCQINQNTHLMDKLRQLECVDVVNLFTQCTSNRFVVLLQFNQKAQVINGPRLDASNHILEKFAQKHNVCVQDLVKHSNGKDDIWAINYQINDNALETCLLNSVLVLDWPEYMVWGCRQAWPRPIRHVCSMLDWQHNPQYIDILDLHTSSCSRISIYRTNDEFKVLNFAQYVDTLRTHGVLIHEKERAQHIMQQAQTYNESLAHKSLIYNESLAHKSLTNEALQNVKEFTQIKAQKFAKFSETPIVCIGKYTDIDMPTALIDLAVEQDYVMTYESANHFICCLDGGLAKLYDGVTDGLSRAISSRLKEIKLIWDYDRSVSIETYRQSLAKKEIFGDKLGSYLQRGHRIVAAANQFDINIHDLDLIEIGVCMSMLNEFDNIHLLCGGLYFNEPLSTICLNIHGYVYEDIAINASTDQSLHKTSIILSIIMAVDTLLGLLGVGAKVKGSSDPLAMKRLGNFLVKANHFKKLNLNHICKCLLTEYLAQNIKLTDDAVQLFNNFIEKRIEHFLSSISERSSMYIAKDSMHGWRGDILVAEIDQHPDIFSNIMTMHKRVKGMCKGYNHAIYDQAGSQYNIQEYVALKSIVNDFNHSTAGIHDIHNILHSAINLLDNVIISALPDNIKHLIMHELTQCINITNMIYNV
jgi:glycyl-tRNA synthetase beta subunit